jgi:hypothetical protein
MLLVIFNISVIIDDINAARHQTKTDKTAQQIDGGFHVKDLASKKYRDKQEKIFYPIFWSNQLNICAHQFTKFGYESAVDVVLISFSINHNIIGNIINMKGTINSLVWYATTER